MDQHTKKMIAIIKKDWKEIKEHQDYMIMQIIIACGIGLLAFVMIRDIISLRGI